MDKVVLNVAVSIVLVAIYIYFFGQHSVQKFLNKSVIITENEENQDAISPPGIITYIQNRSLLFLKTHLHTIVPAFFMYLILYDTFRTSIKIQMMTDRDQEFQQKTTEFCISFFN